MIKKYLLSAVALLAALAADAKIMMAPPFSDNMVLQRDKEVSVFGKATPNKEVTVEFAGQTAKVKADTNGKWLATLKPMKASAENRVMTVKENGSDKVEIKNVLVGEVWLCSGQSNMECPLWGGATRYRAQNGGLLAQLANYDNIRFLKVKRAMSVTPCETLNIKWSPLIASNLEARGLSATATFFGMQLYQSLGVPVALIDSSWGGTLIEPWTPAGEFDSFKSLNHIAEKSRNLQKDYTQEEKKEAQKQGRKLPSIHQQPTVVYNAMINPLVPYTIRGAIWYQGCSNLGQWFYADLMQALYNGWSKKFKNPDLQFFFVQLSPFIYGKDNAQSQENLAKSWEQQRSFAKKQPNAGMILTNDIGDLYDIHPYDKQSVGLRLAALALQRTYKFPIKAEYPSIKEAKVDGDKVVMSFDNVKKFFARSQNRPDGDKVHFMEIAGEDGKFISAEVEIKGAKLVAKSNGVAKPKTIRFLYAPKSQCNVFNEYGLPLDAFKINLK